MSDSYEILFTICVGIPDKRPSDKKPPDKRPLKMPAPDKRPHGQKTTRTKGHQAGFSTEKS